MKLINKMIAISYTLLLCYIVAFFINSFLTNGYVLSFDIALMFSHKTFLYTIELVMFVFAIYLTSTYKKYVKNSGNSLLESKEKDKHILSGLEQAHFQTEEELNKNYKTVDYNKLKNQNINGLPIKAEVKNNKLNITFAKPAHSLIIGTTGSGKTTSLINPTVQILSGLKNKPSMIISDPKGELYALHTKSLIAKGYEVKVLDLRNPYRSVQWNPLEKVYEKYHRALNLKQELVTDEEKGCFIFDNKTYYNKQELNSSLQVKKQELNDEVYEDLHDIVSVLCPVSNSKDPIWESGARNFILAILLAMLEDSEKPELGLNKEKFNFYNLMKIATNTDNDSEELKRYFKGRSLVSKSVSLSKQVLSAGEKTRGSYLSTVFDKLSLFADLSLCSLTSRNNINFNSFARKPTAFFLQIPDEKETRHTLASMVILQAYKELVAEANKYEELALPRNVHFLLDEFGNLPRIHKLEQMITVGRSRKIWFSLVIQSYSQLAKVYDEKSADIIKSNCNIQMFIGTTDLKTIQDFSRLCGNYSIVSRNVSFGKKGDTSTSASVKERPLIYASELQKLNSPRDMGNMIVNVFGYSPIKSKFTPSYLCKKYELEKTNQKLEAGNYFDEEKVFYDTLQRNKIILGEQQKRGSLQNGTKNLIAKLKLEIDQLSNEYVKDTTKVNLKELIDRSSFDEAYKMVDEMIEKYETMKEGELLVNILSKVKKGLEVFTVSHIRQERF